MVEGSHSIGIRTDLTYDKITKENLAGIILPGGLPGTTNLEANETVKEYIMYCFENKLLLAAICAAPSILGKKGILNGKKAVCFPGFENFLEGAEIPEQGVVCDGKVITGKGPGVALEFGLELSKLLAGEAKAAKVKASLQCC